MALYTKKRFGLEKEILFYVVSDHVIPSEGNGEMVDIIHKYRDDEIRDLDNEGFSKNQKKN